MNVSPDFSLPIRVIAPYFISGTVFYIAAMSSLIGISPSAGMSDYRLLGWVHLYMIGFVMMIIIGAMGQMSVVVGEVHHRYPKVFWWISPLLTSGTVLLVAGMYLEPLWMAAGGVILFVALGLFAFNLFFTLKQSRRRTSIIRSMQWSTFFLMIGVGIGIFMASGYAGITVGEFSALREVHVVTLIGGYVMINIMGVSTVLLPMFDACARPSDNDYTISFSMMSGAVIVMFASAWGEWIEWTALALAFGSLIYYMYRVYRIFTSKSRLYNDIWERSVAVAFGSLLLSVIATLYGYVTESEKGVILGFWFFTAGFLGFLISAHLYKIVPFLVWFERFAPYVDERSIPMMHELLPQIWAKIQWQTALAGTVGIAFAIIGESRTVMAGSALLMSISGIVLLGVIVRTIRFKGVDR